MVIKIIKNSKDSGKMIHPKSTWMIENKKLNLEMQLFHNIDYDITPRLKLAYAITALDQIERVANIIKNGKKKKMSEPLKIRYRRFISEIKVVFAVPEFIVSSFD